MKETTINRLRQEARDYADSFWPAGSGDGLGVWTRLARDDFAEAYTVVLYDRITEGMGELPLEEDLAIGQMCVNLAIRRSLVEFPEGSI